MYKNIIHHYKYIDINNIERENIIIFSPIINNRELYSPNSMYILKGKLSELFDINNNINIINEIIPLEKTNNEIGHRNFLFIDNLDWNIFDCNMEIFQLYSQYKQCPIFSDMYISLYSLLEYLQIRSKNNKEKPSYTELLNEYWDYYHQYTLDEWNEFPDDYYVYTLIK